MTVEIRETLLGEIFLWHHGQAMTLRETEKPDRQKNETKKRNLRNTANPLRAIHGRWHGTKNKDSLT